MSASKIFTTMRNRIGDWAGGITGLAGDKEYAGVRMPMPYKAIDNNGTFVAWDNVPWVYFKLPEVVDIEFVRRPIDAVENQMFLTNIFNDLGRSLGNTSSVSSTSNDRRYRFHMPFIMQEETGIERFDGITPAHDDFISRMPAFAHPVWHGYIGVQLTEGSIYSEAYKLTDKVRAWVDFMANKVDVNEALYGESFRTVAETMLANGCRPLDFTKDTLDRELLTGWFSDSDLRYGVNRSIDNATFQNPEHGKSVITPLREYSFFSIRPRESRDEFIKDPLDMAVRFSQVLKRPSARVHHINIRGEVRSPETAAKIFDSKGTKSELAASREYNPENSSISERKLEFEKSTQSEIAAWQALRMGSALLDNVETTIAVEITDKDIKLNEELAMFGLEASNIIKRQQFALLSTIPCYPKSIFPIPKRDGARNPNVRVMFASPLSLSGLTGAAKVAGKEGLLLGLADTSNYEFLPIYREFDAPNRYARSPLAYLAGSSGSGKALPLTAPIPTPDGWRKVGDIKVGDRLVGPDGRETSVTYLSPVETKPLYTLVTSDGEKTFYDRNHQIILVDHGHGRSVADHYRAIDVLSTLVGSGDETLVTPGEVLDVLRENGVTVFGNAGELIAAVDFVQPHPAVADEHGRFVARDLWHALYVRVSQRVETVSYRDGVSMIRMTVGELSHSRLNIIDENGYSAKRFSIYPTGSVVLGDDEPQNMPIDPFVAGVLSTIPHYGDDGKFFFSTDTARSRFIASMSGYADAKEWGRDGVSVSKSACATLRASVIDFFDGFDGVHVAMNSEQRAAFIDGLLSCAVGDNIRLANTPLLRVAAEALRCDGYSCTVDKDTMTIVDVTRSPVDIMSVTRNDNTTHKVRCLQVDNVYRSFLCYNYLPTSNTVQALMMVAQTVYSGRSVVFLNPKPSQSLEDFFRILDGTVIRLSTEYLEANPGMLDPMRFIEDKELVGRLLADMIIRSGGLGRMDKAEQSAMSTLRAQLIERAQDPVNLTSYDVIFGRSQGVPPEQATKPITMDSVIDFVFSKMKMSAIWKSMISPAPKPNMSFEQQIKSGRPILVEWDKSIAMPDKNQSADSYDDVEQDAIQSVVNLFTYATEIIGNSTSGGLLVCDEAHNLKPSEAIMQRIKKIGREGRTSNINLLLISQELADFADDDDEDNLLSFISLFIIMRLERKAREKELFYNITDIEDDGDAAWDYVLNAGLDKVNKKNKKFPNAFVVDRIYDYLGGIICGPWPDRELQAALSETDAVAARKAELARRDHEESAQAEAVEKIAAFRAGK